MRSKPRALADALGDAGAPEDFAAAIASALRLRRRSSRSARAARSPRSTARLLIGRGAAVDVVDTTGAGDAFAGVLAAALDRGADWPTAIAEGVAAGSLACHGSGRATRPPGRCSDRVRLRRRWLRSCAAARCLLLRRVQAERWQRPSRDASAASRCRTHSNRHTAAAAAALSDSTPAASGSSRAASPAPASARESPAPSLPIASAIAPPRAPRTGRRRRRRRSRRRRRRSRDKPRAHAGRSTSSWMSTQEMRALPRAQHLGRPRERAMLRQQHLRHAGRGGGAKHRADVARILHVVQQQAEIGEAAAAAAAASARRPARRRSPAASRSRRTALRDDERALRVTLGQRPRSRASASASSATISVSGAPCR